jgi:hypothetical protein
LKSFCENLVLETGASETTGEDVPQGLKPSSAQVFMARLKPCPSSRESFRRLKSVGESFVFKISPDFRVVQINRTEERFETRERERN